MRKYGMITVLCLLAACQQQSTQQRMVSQGYTESFAAGYDDGCHSSGSYFSQYMKDTRRYAADPEYKQGWSSGFAGCGVTQQNDSLMQGLAEQQKETQRIARWRLEQNARQGLVRR